MKGNAHAITSSTSASVSVFLDTSHLHAAEESRRAHEQHADDDDQRHRELEVVADDEGAEHVLQHADHQPAEHRPAGGVAPPDHPSPAPPGWSMPPTSAAAKA